MTDTLNALAANPDRIADLPDTEIRRLLVEITVLQARLSSLVEGILIRVLPRADKVQAEDRLLQVEEAAAMLGVDERWIRRRARTLPFVRRLSGKAIRISEEGLKRWVAGKRSA
jgi:excisionase family DNA binding protein